MLVVGGAVLTAVVVGGEVEGGEVEGGSMVGRSGPKQAGSPKFSGSSPKVSEEQLKNVGQSKLGLVSNSDSQLLLTDSHKLLHGLTVKMIPLKMVQVGR